MQQLLTKPEVILVASNNSFEGPNEKSFEVLESQMEEVRLRKKNSLITKFR
jgi:hypothetical protein